MGAQKGSASQIQEGPLPESVISLRTLPRTAAAP